MVDLSTKGQIINFCDNHQEKSASLFSKANLKYHCIKCVLE
jgi:hypothetical protein